MDPIDQTPAIDSHSTPAEAEANSLGTSENHCAAEPFFVCPSAEAAWSRFLMAMGQTSSSTLAPSPPRPLVLDEQVCLVAYNLRPIVDEIKKLPKNQRPTEITLKGNDSELNREERSKAKLHVAELFQLCRESTVKLRLGCHAVIEMVVSNTHKLKKLNEVSLHGVDIHNTSLRRMFSSSGCQIESIKITGTNDLSRLTAVLKVYGGLKRLSVQVRCTSLMEKEQVKSLTRSIVASPSSKLSHLDLSCNGIDYTSLRSIVSILAAQQHLRMLNLSGNHLFQSYDEDSDEYQFRSSSQIDKLQEVLAQHPSLNEVILDQCPMTTKTFGTLLSAAMVPGNQLQKLSVCCMDSSIKIRSDWVDHLPHLTGLQSLMGVQHLFSQERWKTDVVPQLRRNTTLVDLRGDGVWQCHDDETTRILARNRVLPKLAACSPGTPPLSVWSRLLHGWTHSAEASVVFAFLRKKSCELPSLTNGNVCQRGQIGRWNNNINRRDAQMLSSTIHRNRQNSTLQTSSLSQIVFLGTMLGTASIAVALQSWCFKSDTQSTSSRPWVRS